MTYLSLPPQVGELTLRSQEKVSAPISYSTQESVLYTSTGQHSSAGPKGISEGELVLPLAHLYNGELARAMLDNLPWWRRQGRAGGLTNPATNQAQNQGYMLAHPIYNLLENR